MVRAMEPLSFLMPPVMMTALLSFTIANNLTPGPNNLMLAASGVNFGLGRTWPHMAGISAGYVIVLLLVGFGLGSLIQAFPGLRMADAFRARAVDTTHASFVFEITGAPEKINSFIELMRPLGLVDVSRTGVAAMSRGSEAM